MSNLLSSWISEFGVTLLLGYALLTSFCILFLLGNIRAKVQRKLTLSDVMVRKLFRLGARVEAFCEACESFLTTYREVKREVLSKMESRAFSTRFQTKHEEDVTQKVH